MDRTGQMFKKELTVRGCNEFWLSLVSFILVLFVVSGYGYKEKPGLLLTFSPDAKSESLANATAALSGDNCSALQNPASMNNLKTKSFSATYSSYLSDISFFSFSFGLPLNNNNIALNIMYLNLGEFEKVVTEGGDKRIESAGSETAIVLSYSRGIFGVSGKLFLSSLAENNGSGFAVDAGFLKNNFPFENFSIASVIQNLGFGIKFRSERENLPLNFKIASSYQVRYGMIKTKFLFDFNIPTYYKPYSGIGCEFDCGFGKDIGLQLRTGYKINQDLGFLAGLTFGLGIKYTIFNIDYAYVNYGILESMNKITLSVKF